MGVTLLVPNQSLIPPSPPAERRAERQRDWRAFLRDHISYSGRLALPMQDGSTRVIRPRLDLSDLARWFMRGLGGMTGMVSEGGRIEASFGPMGSSGLAITAPTAFWRMDEASGSRLDSAGSNDLSVNGTVSQVTGKLGFGAGFTGGFANNLTHATNATLTTGAIDFAFFGWAYFNSLTNQMLFSKGNGTLNNSEYMLQMSNNAGNKFRWFISNTDFVTATSFGALSAGTWYFFFCSYKTSTTTLRISVNNGTVDSDNTGTDPTPGGIPAAFFVGCQAGIQQGVDGRIDALAFFKTTIPTTAEVTAAYNGGVGTEFYSGAWH